MVHISEVANTFVNEIKDHLTEGQTVKVKVLNQATTERFRFHQEGPACATESQRTVTKVAERADLTVVREISTVREALRADLETSITGITTETERHRILRKILRRYTMLTAIQETLILRICSASSRRQARRDFLI